MPEFSTISFQIWTLFKHFQFVTFASQPGYYATSRNVTAYIYVGGMLTRLRVCTHNFALSPNSSHMNKELFRYLRRPFKAWEGASKWHSSVRWTSRLTNLPNPEVFADISVVLLSFPRVAVGACLWINHSFLWEKCLQMMHFLFLTAIVSFARLSVHRLLKAYSDDRGCHRSFSTSWRSLHLIYRDFRFSLLTRIMSPGYDILFSLVSTLRRRIAGDIDRIALIPGLPAFLIVWHIILQMAFKITYIRSLPFQNLLISSHRQSKVFHSGVFKLTWLSFIF